MTDIETQVTQHPLQSPDGLLRKRGRPFGTKKKTSAEVAENQRVASSRWYYNNHEYRCNQKKKYYAENRDKILENRKQKKNVVQ